MKKVLLTGGQSSGKSSKALEIADKCSGGKYFIATARHVDDETSKKIERHIEEREGRYETHEEPLRVTDALAGIMEKKPGAVIIDCVTMWVSNLLIESGEEELNSETDRFVEFISNAECTETDGVLVIVTNEVGSGIIPMYELSRKYCSALGRMNKKIARVCDEVYLMACGLGLRLK